MLLTNCGGYKAKPVLPVAIEYRSILPIVPTDLMICDVPVPSDIGSGADATDYVIRLHQAAMACQTQMQAVQAILAPK